MEPEVSGSLPLLRLQGKRVWADQGGEKSAPSGLRSFSPVTPGKTDLLMSSSQKACSIYQKRFGATTQITVHEMKPGRLYIRSQKLLINISMFSELKSQCAHMYLCSYNEEAHSIPGPVLVALQVLTLLSPEPTYGGRLTLL